MWLSNQLTQTKSAMHEHSYLSPGKVLLAHVSLSVMHMGWWDWSICLNLHSHVLFHSMDSWNTRQCLLLTYVAQQGTGGSVRRPSRSHASVPTSLLSTPQRGSHILWHPRTHKSMHKHRLTATLRKPLRTQQDIYDSSRHQSADSTIKTLFSLQSYHGVESTLRWSGLNKDETQASYKGVVLDAW